MSNNIKFLFNIKNEHLLFDEKIPFEEHNGCKISHLIQSYEMKCPQYVGKECLKMGLKK